MLLFLKVFFTEFIAEMGDKTQLMLIALTPKYKLKDIMFGTAAAILVLNGLAVLAGGLVSEFIPDWLIKTAAALAFLYFAASTISPISIITENIIDLCVLIAFTICVWIFAGTKKKIGKIEGFAMVAFYAAYAVYIIIR